MERNRTLGGILAPGGEMTAVVFTSTGKVHSALHPTRHRAGIAKVCKNSICHQMDMQRACPEDAQWLILVGIWHIWEEGISAKALLISNWLVGMSVSHFLANPSPPWAVPSLGRWSWAALEKWMNVWPCRQYSSKVSDSVTASRFPTWVPALASLDNEL